MTGKDLYKAMQNIDESLITESANIKITKKKVKWQLTESQRDNLATAAIILFVIGIAAIVPVIVRNGGLGATGINATSAVDATSATDVAVEKPTEDTTESEEKETDKVQTDGDTKDNTVDPNSDRKLLANAVMASGSIVIDGRLYEYDRANDRFIISQSEWTNNGGVLNFGVGGYSLSSRMQDAIAYNAIVTPENYKDMYYLVEITVYDDAEERDNILGDNDSKEVYQKIKASGKYDVRWAKNNEIIYTWDNEDVIWGEDQYMYGILSYEQMKAIAKDHNEYGFYYSLISKTVKSSKVESLY